MKKRILAYFLFLCIPSLTIAESGPIGWASVNANGQQGTTGGAGGTTITVTNLTDLILYSGKTEPYIIQIEGLITVTPKGRHIAVKSDKTIIGITNDAGITQGGFSVGSNQKNIIFKNLTISDTFLEGDWDGKDQDWDGIQIKGTCHHIWVDHCTFLRQGDGALDITNGANYITVSNSIFAQNNKTGLVGSSDTDTHTDKYKVTYHLNWFNATTQRNPRVRFGMVHIFNNYYYDMGGYGREMGYAISNGYGIGVGASAQIYSENNFFEKVVYPAQFYDNLSQPGFIIDIGSHFVGSGSMQTKPEGMTWKPEDYYDYTLMEAADVKDFVMANAGAGQLSTSLPAFMSQDRSLSFTAFPNPLSSASQLQFSLPEAGMVNIQLFDLTGRMVQLLTREGYPAGNNQITLFRGDLKSGIYLMRLEFQGTTLTRKIVIN